MVSIKIKSRVIFVIIAFFALFTYLYPVAFKFLPFDTGMLLHIIGFMYFCACQEVRYLNRRLFNIYLWAFVLFIVGWLSTAVFNESYDFGVLRKIVAVILYSFSSYLVVELIRKVTVNFSFFTLLEWIVYAAFVQAILSIILFLSPELMKLYLNSIRLNEISENVMRSLSSFRLIAVANVQYANMAVMYGIAFLSALTLPFSKHSVLYQHKILYYILVFTILIAGIFSARTFFLILLFSLVYLFYLLWKKKGSLAIGYGIGIIVISIFILFGSYLILKNSENERTYQWMFEWYINLSEKGSFETNSTNTLKNMYHWPDQLKTWIIGDGKFQSEGGGFYKNTDVGYLRNLFYWGLLGSFFFYFVQYQYYRIVKSATSILLIKRFLGFLMIWVIVYNVKEFWYANLYWVLFLTTLLKVKL